MFTLLISIVTGLFIALLFLNIYFRSKVLKSYKVLVKNKVEFEAVHLFNRKKMEKEIYPKYPHLKAEIETFASHIRYSIRIGTVLLALITIFGGILMYYRE